MLFAYLISLLCALYGTFVFFVAVMKLRDARDAGLLKNAPRLIMAFAYLTLITGLISDAILNLLLSPLFFELPKEFLTTARIKRLKIDGTDWQKRCANWLCNQLKTFDINHC